MTEDSAEAAFRAHMRALGRKGGASTKRRMQSDPHFYRRIGRMGGQASARALWDKLAAEHTPGMPVILAQQAATPPSQVSTTKAAYPSRSDHYSLEDVLTSLNGPSRRS